MSDGSTADASRWFGSPSPARVLNYWLGGKDHYAVDRLAADRVSAVAPCVVAAARADRAFVRRAAAVMAREGLVQFVDLGCGFPLTPAVHDVVRRVAPDARVVYVERDDAVLAHARAVWGSLPGVLVQPGDLRSAVDVLSDPACAAYLDATRPVGVLLASTLHALDDDEAVAVLANLRHLLKPGSLLALSHVSLPESASAPRRPIGGRSVNSSRSRPDHRIAAAREGSRLYDATIGPCRPRTHDDVMRLLDGWSLLEPGLVDVAGWRRLPGRSRQRLPVLAALVRREDR